MFVATKADHITTDQIQNLISLMRQLVQEAVVMLNLKGLIQNTRQLLLFVRLNKVLVNQNGKQIKAIQGVRSLDKNLLRFIQGLYQVNYLMQSSGQNNLLILIPLNLKFYNKVKAFHI